MLVRTLEPEVMDDPIESSLYNDMNHADVNCRFVDDLLAGGLVGPDIIDLGTGTALIPVLLCQRLPHIRVMATDAATSMLEIARFNIELGGVVERVQLVLADVKDPRRFMMTTFNTVISNSLLHHLTDPLAALRTVVRLVVPGGRVFLRDLLRPHSTEEVETLVKQHASDEPSASQQLFRQSLHAALSLDELRSMVDAVGFSSEGLKQTSDRHWTLDVTKEESCSPT